jgi:hypothetical protein
MPRIAIPSDEGRRNVFSEALQHLQQLGRIPPDMVMDPLEHPVYLLDADQLGKGSAADTVRMAGWRYFAYSRSSRKMVVAADIADGNPPRLLNISQGEQAIGEYARVKEADSLEDMKAQDFELRTLRVPAALSQSVWVKPATSNGTILPFGKTFLPEPDAARLRYDLENYLQKLRPTDPIPTFNPNTASEPPKPAS